MAEAAVRPDLDQTADVLRNFTAEVALNAEVILDVRSLFNIRYYLRVIKAHRTDNSY